LRNGEAVLNLGLDQDMGILAGQSSCSLLTRDFDETCQRAREAEATFYVELGAIPTGARTFGIKDPDGNAISLVEVS